MKEFNPRHKTRNQLMVELECKWMTIRRQLRQIRSLRAVSEKYRTLYKKMNAARVEHEKFPRTFNLND